MGDHERSCAFREVRCEACGDAVPGKAMDAHVRDACAATVVDCANGCGERMARRLFAAHSAHSCTHARLECAFIKQGCHVRPMRREYAKHQAECASEHARLANMAEQSMRNLLDATLTKHRAEHARLHAEMESMRREI
eukprot:4932854-Pleurochrysis_carterae.AAC.1